LFPYRMSIPTSRAKGLDLDELCSSHGIPVEFHAWFNSIGLKNDRQYC
ncbi:hypothetical protein AVEN_148140-1, partial [Araneus ventricosus]